MEKKILMFISATIVALSVFIFTASDLRASDENGEAYCLALNMYFEAGNQPTAGKIAVSQVVQNRVSNLNYPDTICGVIYQAKWFENWRGTTVPVRNMCQFSWFCDGLPDVPEDSFTWEKSYRLAERILWGEFGDITEGSTHYHADSVHPYWADSLENTVIINNHIFYK
ncbi:MAG TPA: cell wall hydrolase [Saprospirales bacterium]|nr:cell wall hydrolase [Saprospirales bacterium]